MDKETLSHYGWIVVLVLILSVMTALATPFGMFLARGFESTYIAFWYTSNKAEDIIDEGPDPIPEIKDKPDLWNYDSLSAAIGDVNVDTIGEHAIDDLAFEDAVAAVYKDEDTNETITVLLKNTVENEEIIITRSQTIHLGGNQVKFTGTTTGTGFTLKSPGSEPIDVTFDGRLYGSHVLIEDPRACALYVNQNSGVGANATVLGGKWESHATLTDAASRTVTFFVNDYSTIHMEDVVVECYADSDEINTSSVGVRVNRYATAYLDNCNIFADAKYGDSIYEDVYNATSEGITNHGTTLIKNSEIFGTLTAIGNYGTLYVEGGKYHSTGHGGLYASKTDNTRGICYLRDASFEETVNYTGRYDIAFSYDSSWNQSGIYVGGTAQAQNIKVYADNCNFYGQRTPINIRYNVGAGYTTETWKELNNSVYISNSTINHDSEQGIVVRHPSHSLYIGSGNNFSQTDVGDAKTGMGYISYADRAFSTNQVYARGEALDNIFALTKPPAIDQLPA